mmetsp:Transcript_42439/g.136033  ORF Transcript_42439/g.136033 Transcript_42439/m.136033 type:complete len:266 (+) Transcript_42439:3992-4789(+)
MTAYTLSFSRASSRSRRVRASSDLAVSRSIRRMCASSPPAPPPPPESPTISRRSSASRSSAAARSRCCSATAVRMARISASAEVGAAMALARREWFSFSRRSCSERAWSSRGCTSLAPSSSMSSLRFSASSFRFALRSPLRRLWVSSSCLMTRSWLPLTWVRASCTSWYRCCSTPTRSHAFFSSPPSSPSREDAKDPAPLPPTLRRTVGPSPMARAACISAMAARASARSRWSSGISASLARRSSSSYCCCTSRGPEPCSLARCS